MQAAASVRGTATSHGAVGPRLVIDAWGDHGVKELSNFVTSAQRFVATINPSDFQYSQKWYAPPERFGTRVSVSDAEAVRQPSHC